MTGTGTLAAAAAQPGREEERSREAARLFADLMALPPDVRRAFLRELDVGARARVLAVAAQQGGTPYCLWADDPVGFVEDVLGETLWSRQREILAALTDHRRIAVPSGFGTGKTWLAARAVAHFVCTRPAGVGLAVTIATRMRQVQRQLWPHVRRLHARAGLPGQCDMTQWRMPDPRGVDTDVAYGFTTPDHDEAAMQGIHAGALLLVVDEAGGIGHLIGRSTRNLLTGDARMLAIGNPPTDDESSWFETLCAAGDDPDRPADVAIRIRALDSPAITGEQVGRCMDCPPASPPHPLSDHLVDQAWVDDAIREHGEDAAYVQAKVYARFPKGGPSRAIPSAWLEAAVNSDEPEPGDGWVRLRDLDVPGEPAEWAVQYGAWVRLGVDVAAGGGDELGISRCVGDLLTIEHTSAGAVNNAPYHVAGVVLREIRRAEQLRQALGTAAPVRVKIDAIGVGWGVAGILEAWAAEGVHSAEVVRVVVSEETGRAEETGTLRPWRKRDEMWLAMREMLAPPAGPRLRMRIDNRTFAQLTGPGYTTNSTGFTVIEAKSALKARGLSSPDRAEAGLLAVYEPLDTSRKKRRKVQIVAG